MQEVHKDARLRVDLQASRTRIKCGKAGRNKRAAFPVKNLRREHGKLVRPRRSTEHACAERNGAAIADRDDSVLVSAHCTGRTLPSADLSKANSKGQNMEKRSSLIHITYNTKRKTFIRIRVYFQCSCQVLRGSTDRSGSLALSAACQSPLVNSVSTSMRRYLPDVGNCLRNFLRWFVFVRDCIRQV